MDLKRALVASREYLARGAEAAAAAGMLCSISIHVRLSL